MSVNPAVLQWARETAGVSVADVARRLNRTEAVVHQWEAGELAPALGQLRDVASVYHRPLSALLLPEPPVTPGLPPDFRTAAGQAGTPVSQATRFAIRRARRAQVAANEIAAAADVVPFRGAVGAQEPGDPDVIAPVARSLLQVPMDVQMSWGSPSQAFLGWRDAIERVGVIVMQATLIVDEVRGFSIAGPGFPVIVANSADHMRSRVFTLIHEFVHIMRGREGICLPDPLIAAHTADDAEERLANRTAGAVLLPADVFAADPAAQTLRLVGVGDDRTLNELAERYSVSKYVVWYRALDTGLVPAALYRERWAIWRRIAAATRAQRKSGGGERVVDRALRENGPLLARLITTAETEGRLPTMEAGDLLGVGVNRLADVAAQASVTGA